MSDLLTLPGFTDLYARLREPGPSRRGNLQSETRAAYAAGFTRVCAAPDTDPAMDSTATVELVQHHAATADAASVLPMAALTIGLDGDRLTELATLQALGCVAASQADQPIADTRLLYDAMAYAASFDFPLIMRARDSRLGINGCVHEGTMATRLGLPGVPAASETIALARLLELLRETGGQLHVSRLSTARAVQMISEARDAGLSVTADVGIAHLYFTEDDIGGFDSRYASSVPFRTSADREALREGVRQGVIDAICSDHAPLDNDAALAPFPVVEPGLSMFDRFMPLWLALPSYCDIDFDRALNAVTRAPEAILKLAPSTDTIQVDATATADTWWSRGRNSPLVDTWQLADGTALSGKVVCIERQSDDVTLAL